MPNGKLGRLSLTHKTLATAQTIYVMAPRRIGLNTLLNAHPDLLEEGGMISAEVNRGQ